MADLPDLNSCVIYYWMLIPAVSIILLLSFLEKSKRRQGWCHGRPAILIPFSFLDGYDNRIVYAVTFGTVTSTVISLVTSSQDMGLDLWAQALFVYLQAMVGCLACYPLFLCLTTRHKVVGALLCLVYSLSWLAMSLSHIVQVVKEAVRCNSSDTKEPSVIVHVTFTYRVMSGLPINLCFLVLVMHCCHTLHKCFTSKSHFYKQMESLDNPHPHQEQHVRWVLRKYRINQGTLDDMNCSLSKRFVDQIKDSIRLHYFTSFPFFKYPTRMVALSFVQLNILYWAGLFLMMTVVKMVHGITHSVLLMGFVDPFQEDITVIFHVSLGVAIIVCILNGQAQIFVGAKNYRYDLLRIYQGDRTFVPVSAMTPQNSLTRSMTFPGYQVAFMLWGILLCFTTVFLLTAFPALFLYFTYKFDMLRDLASNLAQLLSFPMTAIVMFCLLVFMAKRVLLQAKIKNTDKDPPLNINNRKFYEVINYYSLFTNMTVGLFTCMFRIVQNAFFGIFFVARLDRSEFPHNLHSWDRGYAAYISMLLVDNAHNNPCMRVFTHLLWTKTMAARSEQVEGLEESCDAVPLIPKSRGMTNQMMSLTDENSTASNHFDNGKAHAENGFTELRTSSKTRTRWHLAYTLINNPQLRKLRKQKLKNDNGTN